MDNVNENTESFDFNRSRQRYLQILKVLKEDRISDTLLPEILVNYQDTRITVRPTSYPLLRGKANMIYPSLLLSNSIGKKETVFVLTLSNIGFTQYERTRNSRNSYWVLWPAMFITEVDIKKVRKAKKFDGTFEKVLIEIDNYFQTKDGQKQPLEHALRQMFSNYEEYCEKFHHSETLQLPSRIRLLAGAIHLANIKGLQINKDSLYQYLI